MDRVLSLEVEGPKVRNVPWISRRDKAIVCGWAQNTVVPNIIWFRLLTIKWRWPPIRVFTCFTWRDEPPEETFNQ